VRAHGGRPRDRCGPSLSSGPSPAPSGRRSARESLRDPRPRPFAILPAASGEARRRLPAREIGSATRARETVPPEAAAPSRSPAGGWRGELEPGGAAHGSPAAAESARAAARHADRLPARERRERHVVGVGAVGQADRVEAAPVGQVGERRGVALRRDLDGVPHERRVGAVDRVLSFRSQDTVPAMCQAKAGDAATTSESIATGKRMGEDVLAIGGEGQSISFTRAC
jgi:hypothetical protein